MHKRKWEGVSISDRKKNELNTKDINAGNEAQESEGRQDGSMASAPVGLDGDGRSDTHSNVDDS